MDSFERISPTVDIALGDCLELMREIPSASVDMVLCDLPYGTTRNAWDSVIPFEPLWTEWRRVCKRSAAIVLFSQQPFSSALIESNCSMFRYEWIWRKNQSTGFLNANRMPLKVHENILVFYSELPIYNPQKTIDKPYQKRKSSRKTTNYGEFGSRITYSYDGKRYPVDIIEKSVEVGLHPTQKPVSLLEYFIRTYTNSNDIVLDNCMGSGSTGVACINTDRRFVGIELEDGYYAIAKKRLTETAAQTKLFTCEE